MNSVDRTRSERGLKALLVRWRRRMAVLLRALWPAQLSEAAGPGSGGHGSGGHDSPTPLPETLALATGVYITDGCSLLRIEHVHTDRASGTTFVELEDCATMELSVCTAESLASQALRSVVPVQTPQRPFALPASRASIRAHGGRAAAPR